MLQGKPKGCGQENRSGHTVDQSRTTTRQCLLREARQDSGTGILDELTAEATMPVTASSAMATTMTVLGRDSCAPNSVPESGQGPRVSVVLRTAEIIVPGMMVPRTLPR